jgi:hypothetical protein
MVIDFVKTKKKWYRKKAKLLSRLRLHGGVRNMVQGRINDIVILDYQII